MKILYAIKDKYRGAEELVTWEGVPGTVAAWDNKYDAKSELPYLGDEAEVVPLLVLPTEPCDWCRDVVSKEEIHQMFENAKIDGHSLKESRIIFHTTMVHGWTLCANCGRILKENEEDR